MAKIFTYRTEEELEQLAMIMEIDGDTIGRRVENEILRMKVRNISDEEIMNILRKDFAEGGRVFGQIKSQFKSTVNNGIDTVVQGPLYESGGLETWITTSGRPCEDCAPRHLQKKTHEEWVSFGLPRSGFSVCNENCMCILVPEDSVPEDFGEPVDIPPLKDLKDDFERRRETDPELKKRIAKYNEWRRQRRVQVQERVPKAATEQFRPAASIEEANERLAAYIRPAEYRVSWLEYGVNFEGLPLNKMNKVLKASDEILGKYNIRVNAIGYQQQRKQSWGYFGFNPKYLQDPQKGISYIGIQKTFAKQAEKLSKEVMEKFLKQRDVDMNFFQDGINRLSQVIERAKSAGMSFNPSELERYKSAMKRIQACVRSNVFGDDPIYACMAHECSHAVYFQHRLEEQWIKKLQKSGYEIKGRFDSEARKFVLFMDDPDAYSVSRYATSDISELFAEIGAAVKVKIPVPKKLLDVYNEVIQEVIK